MIPELQYALTLIRCELTGQTESSSQVMGFFLIALNMNLKYHSLY